MAPQRTGPGTIRALSEKGRDWVSRGISAWPTPFRLMLLSAAVGIVAGLGAILFDKVLGLSMEWILKGVTGYSEPAVGAWVWASGNHVWIGTNGTLTATAIANAKTSQRP